MLQRTNSILMDTKGLFTNTNCLLLNCGPSLNNYSESELRLLAKDKKVAAVKLAYNVLPDLVDIHFFNCCNLPKPNKGIFYDYKNNNIPTLVVGSSNYPRNVRLGNKQRMDVFHKVPQLKNPQDCVILKKNFDDYLLDKTTNRPVGPGIMGETVLYYLIHLGFKKITAVGWDLTKTNGKYDHFWKERVHIPGHILDWEIQAWIDASADIYNWLKSHNVELEILGNSKLSDSIPRV
jgi:hypothetical protein